MFILALLAFFAIALPDNMLGVAWPFMRVTFNQPLAAMTLVLPFGVAATLVSTTSWTWAAARLGLGRLLAASVVMSTVGLLLTAIAPAYWVVVACAVLFGLSAGSIDAALNAYAARHFGARRINLMHAAYGIGAATSPLVVTGVVSSGHSWRGAYLGVDDSAGTACRPLHHVRPTMDRCSGRSARIRVSTTTESPHQPGRGGDRDPAQSPVC